MLTACLLQLITITALALADASCPAEAELWMRQEDDAQLVDWVVRKGGFFSPSIAIHAGKLGRGIFATAPIKEGEEIVKVPVSLIIADSEVHPCLTVDQLRVELMRGTCSKFWPYIKSLQDVVMDMPNLWGAEDRALLDLGAADPGPDWTVHTVRYRECPSYGVGTPISDPFAMRALMLYVSRSGPLGMQPLFDIFNHGYNSTQHYHDEAAGVHTFLAVRDHAPGEEIFNTFHSGAGAGRAILKSMVSSGVSPEGAAEFFRDYGFVEPAPVKWVAAGGGGPIEFVIEDDADPAGSVLPMAMMDEWDSLAAGMPLSETAIAHLRALRTAAESQLRTLAERRGKYRAAGLHCAAALLDARVVGVGAHGEQQQPAAVVAGAAALCGPPTERQQLALKYRAAYETALTAAVTAAKRLLGE